MDMYKNLDEALRHAQDRTKIHEKRLKRALKAGVIPNSLGIKTVEDLRDFYSKVSAKQEERVARRQCKLKHMHFLKDKFLRKDELFKKNWRVLRDFVARQTKNKTSISSSTYDLHRKLTREYRKTINVQAFSQPILDFSRSRKWAKSTPNIVICGNVYDCYKYTHLERDNILVLHVFSSRTVSDITVYKCLFFSKVRGYNFSTTKGFLAIRGSESYHAGTLKYAVDGCVNKNNRKKSMTQKMSKKYAYEVYASILDDIVTIQDSLNAGNCRIGTEAWVNKFFPETQQIQISVRDIISKIPAKELRNKNLLAVLQNKLNLAEAEA